MGNYSVDYADASISGGAAVILLGLIVLCLGMTFLGVKVRYPLLPWLAGLCWWMLAFYIKTNPPGNVEEGSSVHTMMIIIALGIGIAIPLFILWRGTRTTRQGEDGYSVSEDAGGWHMPEWTKGPEAKKRQRKQKRMDGLEDYRERFHDALNPGDKRRRR